ncbi:MAG: RecQ family ATP-dependent DNA helicase [Planctomycetota bacterium]|nr:RecQ family ATP-dependent DNA helicase [Planctomycetota bacterium]
MDVDLSRGLEQFGFETFRPGQREAIETLLEKRRLLLVAPTGGGKSLVYQLPGALFPGTTLVISPLIALMHDQIAALEQRGIHATYLASTLKGDEVRRRMAGVAAGEYKLVYVAPERLSFGNFRYMLADLDCPLIAIDEAHCISEWGHDFRPDYMQIGDVLRALPEARVLACTATATPVVRDEILARLDLPAETPQIVRGFARPNLQLRAAEVSSARDRRERTDLLLAEALGSPGDGRGAAIVYSPTRRRTDEECLRLKEAGWHAAAYHAGMDGGARYEVSQTFASGELEVVVATNAFGMGIDRSDVRAVIHLAPPGSIEAYYQEVGRAGRDDEPAWGLLMTAAQDMPLRRRLLESPSDGRVVDHAVVEHKWGLFLELMRWVEGGSCRHDAILRYFGAEEAASAHGCGKCDVCTSFTAPEHDADEVSTIVRKALSGVARAHRRFGLNVVAKLLRGDGDERLEWSGLTSVSTFGVLKERKEPWLVRLLRRCVTAGWVDFTGGQRPLVRLTETGRQVMLGAAPARLLLPPERVAAASGKRKRGAPAAVELGVEDAELFEKLRAWRLETARHEDVAAYVVASDRCLRDVARLRPANRTELMMAHGIGPSKADKYGDGLIQVVRKHETVIPTNGDGPTLFDGPNA